MSCTLRHPNEQQVQGQAYSQKCLFLGVAFEMLSQVTMFLNDRPGGTALEGILYASGVHAGKCDSFECCMNHHVQLYPGSSFLFFTVCLPVKQQLSVYAPGFPHPHLASWYLEITMCQISLHRR